MSITAPLAAPTKARTASESARAAVAVAMAVVVTAAAMVVAEAVKVVAVTNLQELKDKTWRCVKFWHTVFLY